MSQGSPRARSPRWARSAGRTRGGCWSPGGPHARELLVARLAEAEDAELEPIVRGLLNLRAGEGERVLSELVSSPRLAIPLAALNALSVVDSPEVRELMLRQLGLREKMDV